LNPSKPAILGELKVTGFSSYLHSINDDNTLLVGVGEEADKNGTILGLKISLFDTSDPKSPQLLHNATVEKDQDTWSSSDATYDFKAFRWLSLGKETGVVILPVRVQSWNQDTSGNFDGFYVYDVSRRGISLRFNISHVASEDFFGCYSSAQLPQRSMVFNGNVTTTKGHSVVSTDLDTGKEMWKLDLPKPTNTDYCVAW
jgi:glucose dehydrogenase